LKEAIETATKNQKTSEILTAHKKESAKKAVKRAEKSKTKEAPEIAETNESFERKFLKLFLNILKIKKRKERSPKIPVSTKNFKYKLWASTNEDFPLPIKNSQRGFCL
jgi:hypothetical protein